MSIDRSLEREVAEAFIEAAPSREPDRLFGSIVSTTGRMRPRPRWLALVKEPPMRISTRIVAGSRPARLAYLTLIGLLLLALSAGGIAAGASLLASPPPLDPACAQGFCPGGALTEARAFHTATRLLDGRVLLIGGSPSVEAPALATAEVWDPASRTSTPTGSLNEPRAGHSATLLADGSVLVVGSYDNADASVLASAEIWRPTTGTFTPTGSMAEAGGDHAAVALPDGRVLIIGGITSGHGSRPEAEIWDPASGLFTVAGTLASPRAGHTATLLPDGRVLVIGGFAEGFVSVPTAEVWIGLQDLRARWLPDRRPGVPRRGRARRRSRPRSGWRAGAGRPVPRQRRDLDPETATFAATGPLSGPRGAHAMVGLSDGRVLVVGGDGSDPPETLATAEIWDAASATFSAAGTLAAARQWPSATVLADGRVLVTGGWLPTSVPAESAEIWDPRALAVASR